MTCLFPRKGFRGPKGKWQPFLLGSEGGRMDIPCGECSECRLDQASSMAVRIMHDVKIHNSGSCFITLTFRDEDLPADGSVRVDLLQLFLKRLNHFFGGGMRYYAAAEYGKEFGRAHYHVIVTNYCFDDGVHVSNSSSGEKLYESKALNDLWPYGFANFGEVTFKSAAYVARYAHKKILRLANEFVDKDGVIFDRASEFSLSSNRPGLGKPFLEKFYPEIYANDSCVMNGVLYRVPRYYDKCMQEIDLELLLRVKERRNAAFAQHQIDHAADLTHGRRLVIEKCNSEAVARLKRPLR